MARLECRNCKLFKDDCGHHYKNTYGHINYEAPSLACCNVYGECEFYQEARTERNVCIDNLTEYHIKHSTNANYYIGLAIKVIRNMTDEEFLKALGENK